MKMKILSAGLLVMLLCVGVQAEMYDDFSGETTWAAPSGTSPNEKWTYNYNSATGPLVETGGVLKFCANSGSDQRIDSTQTWSLPTNENESLTFQFKITNANYGDSVFTAHYIYFAGDASTMGIAGGWVHGGDWSFLEKPAWGWQDTGVSVPTGYVWDTVTVEFYHTGSDLRWNIQIERPGMGTYTTDRTLYDGFGNTTVGLVMLSQWGKVQYDYVDVTYVPEPATMGILAVGGLGVLLRRKR